MMEHLNLLTLHTHNTHKMLCAANLSRWWSTKTISWSWKRETARPWARIETTQHVLRCVSMMMTYLMQQVDQLIAQQHIWELLDSHTWILRLIELLLFLQSTSSHCPHAVVKLRAVLGVCKYVTIDTYIHFHDTV